jgi:hypothetical protein
MVKNARCKHCGYEWETRVKKPKACPNCKYRDTVIFTKRIPDVLPPGTKKYLYNSTSLTFNVKEMKILEQYAIEKGISPVRKVAAVIVKEWLRSRMEVPK